MTIKSVLSAMKKVKPEIRLTPTARLLLLILADMDDGSNKVTSSYSELVDLTGVSDKAVARARKELVSKGLVEAETDYVKGTTYTILI